MSGEDATHRGGRRKTLALALAGLVMVSLASYVLGQQNGIEYNVETYIVVPANMNATLRTEVKGHTSTSTASGPNWAWVSIQTSNTLDVNATIRALPGEEWIYGNWTIYVLKKKHASDPYQYYRTLRTGFLNVMETTSAFNITLTPGKGYYKVYTVFNATEW